MQNIHQLKRREKELFDVQTTPQRLEHAYNYKSRSAEPRQTSKNHMTETPVERFQDSQQSFYNRFKHEQGTSTSRPLTGGIRNLSALAHYQNPMTDRKEKDIMQKSAHYRAAKEIISGSKLVSEYNGIELDSTLMKAEQPEKKGSFVDVLDLELEKEQARSKGALN